MRGFIDRVRIATEPRAVIVRETSAGIRTARRGRTTQVPSWGRTVIAPGRWRFCDIKWHLIECAHHWQPVGYGRDLNRSRAHKSPTVGGKPSPMTWFTDG